MEYKFSGSIEIRIPEGNAVTLEGDSIRDALMQLLKYYAEPYNFKEVCVNKKYLKVEKQLPHKIFDVEVNESFINIVKIDTDEHPEITTPEEASQYVYDHLDEYTPDFNYDFTTALDETEVICEDWIEDGETITVNCEGDDYDEYDSN